MARRGSLLLLVALLLLSACSAGDESATDSSDEAAGVPEASGQETADLEGGAAGDEAAPTGTDQDGNAGFAGDGPAEDRGGDSEDESVEEPLAVSVAERTGDRIIKEGTMTIEVAEEGFRVAFQRVVATAVGLGGTVVSSTTTTTEEGATSGTVTVRVPVESYEDLLVSAGEVGDVRSQDIMSQDVTAEYVDLEARLRHEQAQEAFYLGLLEEAAGVPDAIAVQQQLEGIQERIEQIRGRLAVLSDRTSFSTLTVELVEPHTTPLLAESDGPSLAAYVDHAQNAFVTVVGWMIVIGGSLAPVLLPLLLGALAWRLFRRPTAATIDNAK